MEEVSKLGAPKSLLILSSGNINSNLIGELGPLATSHIPIPGGLFLDHQLNSLQQRYAQIFVTLDKSKNELGRVLGSKHKNIKIYYGNSKESIGETIISFLADKDGPNSLDIVYGDSYNTSLFDDWSEKNLLFVSAFDGSSEWDQVNRDSNGELKFTEKSGGKADFTITGSFRILDTLTLKNSLVEAKVKKNEKSNIFHEGLKIYDNRVNSKIVFLEDKSWADLGHRRTYFNQRRNLISNGARVHNSLEFNTDEGWVRKFGDNNKIENELNWFLKLPSSLNKYVPHLKTEQVEKSYSIQYIPSLNVGEHWISENPKKDFWVDLFFKIDLMLSEMNKHREEISVNEVIIAKESIYVGKVKDRFESLIGLLKANNSMGSQELLENKTVFNLDMVVEKICKAGTEASRLPHWNVVHGDLCFSYIIFDQISINPKVIDPRGSFGRVGIFGDPVYELLKLSQCILGDYDYIAADLFNIITNGQELILDYPQVKEHEWVKEYFREYLNERLLELGLSYQTFRILEAGLFLSASSLHPEKNHWLALTIKAKNIVEEAS